MARLRVLFVKPPVEGFHALTAGGRHSPTGLMYLAHALPKHNIDARIFDSLAFVEDTHIVAPQHLSAMAKRKVRTNPLFKHVIHHGASWERIASAVRLMQPDVVAITCLFSPYYAQAYRTAAIVRQVSPRTKLFMGGPHATVAWQHVFAHSCIDAVVLGEGELTFSQLLTDLQASTPDTLASVDISGYPGLIVRRPDGELAANTRQEFVTDLDSLGFPTLEDIDYVAQYAGITSLITSRGCPFSCSFCSVHAIVGKAFRERSVDSVLDEIQWYVKRGVSVFNVEDDNFTYDMERVDRLMHAICRADLKIELRFPNGITALKMDRERLALFARAGVKQLFFGLESTNAETRKHLKKSFAKLDAIEELIHTARARGIYAFASLIIGLPDQTLHDMANDFATMFARGLGASANPYYPIVGTELFRQAKASGLLTEDDLEWYEAMNFAVQTTAFSRSDMAEAFVLGLALVQPGFREYHRRFLQAPHPAALSEVLEALRELGVLVAGTSLDELCLTPRVCVCEEQHLFHRHLSDGGDLGPDSPCALSGSLLKMILQLWTRQAYVYEELTCQVTEAVDRCAFRIRAVPRPLEGIAWLFLAQLHHQLQTGERPQLPPEYDQQATPGFDSYIHIGY